MDKKTLSLLPFATLFLLLSCANGAASSGDSNLRTMFIAKEPDKQSFNVGEAFDVTGLKIVEPSTQQEITGYNLSVEEGHVFVLNDLNIKSVTVSKEGYRPVDFDIKVTNYKLMEITSLPKTEYDLGQTFTHDGLVVIDKETGNPVSNIGISISDGTRFDTLGDREVKISAYGYLPVSYIVHVTNFPQLVISHYPNTVEYAVGDIFSLDGLEVVNGSEIIYEYEVDSKLSPDAIITSAGDYSVVISKEGFKSVKFIVSVYLQKLMSVASEPTKTSYYTGDAFSSSGLVIKDREGNILTDYSVSIEDGEKLKNKGQYNVVVSKEGYKDVSFKINVAQGSRTLSQSKRLNIYYMNDTHGSFYPMEEYSEAGMANVATYIKQLRQNDISNGNYTLLLSGGDMFQGGLESNETKGSIMIDAMNILGFDAMALGNHEFDWGSAYIADFAEQLNCPILSCNTFYSKNKTLRPSYLKPYTVIERGELKIGIIGGVEAGINSSITGSIAEEFYFPAPYEYSKTYSNELRLSYNCDFVIGVYHDGGYETSEGETEPTKYNSVTQVNASTGRKYVDAMFFAHDHQSKRGAYNGVPYLEAGSNSKYLGKMTINFNTDGSLYEMDSYSTYNEWTYTSCTESDTEMLNLITKYSSQIGDPDEVIYTFKYSYGRTDFVAIAVEAMLWYVNTKSPATFRNQHVYFSSHNYQGARANINAGDMTRRNFVKSFPFDNNLCIQKCTPTNIANMRSSTYYVTKAEPNIIYNKDNLTTAVSISFITEYKYAYNYQKSYEKFAPTAKLAFETYLRDKVRTDL